MCNDSEYSKWVQAQAMNTVLIENLHNVENLLDAAMVTANMERARADLAERKIAGLRKYIEENC